MGSDERSVAELPATAEHEGWTRLSFEVELWSRGNTTMPSAEHVLEVTANLKARLLRHATAGNDVVLDLSLNPGRAG